MLLPGGLLQTGDAADCSKTECAWDQEKNINTAFLS